MGWSEEYNERKAGLEEFTQRLKEYIKELLESEKDETTDIKVLKSITVEARLKTWDSINESYQKNPPSGLSEIKDLVGIRVIVPYRKDLDTVKTVLQKKASIFELTDKPQSSKSDEKAGKTACEQYKMGYIFRHCMITIVSDEDDWKSYREQQAEIQIRTYAEHAWAVVSHEIAYKPLDKSETSEHLPEHEKHLCFLSSNAYLFDAQIEAIWEKSREPYEKKGSQQASKIAKQSIDLMVLKTYLEEYANIKSEKTVMDRLIEAATAAKFKLSEEEESNDSIEHLIKVCEKTKIEKMGDLQAVLQSESKDSATSYFQALHKGVYVPQWTVSRSFLIELLLYKRFANSFVKKKDLQELGWSGQLARELVNVLSRYRTEEKS